MATSALAGRVVAVSTSGRSPWCRREGSLGDSASAAIDRRTSTSKSASTETGSRLPRSPETRRYRRADRGGRDLLAVGRDRRQCGASDADSLEVVEADDRDVLRHPPTVVMENLHRAEGERAGECEDGVEQGSRGKGRRSIAAGRHGEAAGGARPSVARRRPPLGGTARTGSPAVVPPLRLHAPPETRPAPRSASHFPAG